MCHLWIELETRCIPKTSPSPWCTTTLPCTPASCTWCLWPRCCNGTHRIVFQMRFLKLFLSSCHGLAKCCRALLHDRVDSHLLLQAVDLMRQCLWGKQVPSSNSGDSARRCPNYPWGNYQSIEANKKCTSRNSGCLHQSAAISPCWMSFSGCPVTVSPFAMVSCAPPVNMPVYRATALVQQYSGVTHFHAFHRISTRFYLLLLQPARAC